MKKLKIIMGIFIAVSLGSVFWLTYHSQLNRDTRELKRQIDALELERYHQRMEIARYHKEEVKLWLEIDRLKNVIQQQRIITSNNVIHSPKSQNGKS